ncbi:RNA polymerase II associated protein 1 [Desmophyllum pertusum]|uniref:RNA polymerase II associated protein 1 n=1 Tax=Desmophyllum pertusum TaxID=174260 RepID=A0A9X0CD35_9CNID|nr:RNA polymerase II associated protein 1 [Desmophyllum pertusum]
MRLKCQNQHEYSSYVSLWHEAALSLFSKIFPGDEFYAFDLLSTILLNAKFFCGRNGPSSVGVTKDLSEMSLATPPLPSTCDTTAASRGELIAQAHKNLPCIRSTFMCAFQGMKHPLDTSRSLSLRQVRNVQSFLIPSCAGPLQPADWMLLPIVDLYNQAISIEMKGEGIGTITGPAVSIVTTTLQLVLLLEEWQPSCLRHVSMASRIARLMCVFLTGSDLFLNSGVHNYLSALLRTYTCPSKLNQLDFNSSIPGLTSFYDLYASLLSQYSAVSFGDALFGCFVTLPLAQKHDVKFRRAVWDEHIGVLRALSIPLDQLPIPLEEFLYPVEQNQSLLALYLRALATQAVRPRWSPLFYLVAVHHVNLFVFQRIDPENVRHDVLYYYKPAATNSSEPFEKFTNLPADRQLLLRNRDMLEECRKIYQTMTSA